MAKFVYRMQNILNIKYKLETQAKSAYGEAKANLDREEEVLNQLYGRKSSYEEKLRNSMGDSLNILQIKQLENAVETMKYKIKVQLIAVKNARQKLELARQKLSEAMIERKTHEKLRENAFEEFKLEINSQEIKEIDELTSFKYSHRVIADA